MGSMVVFLLGTTLGRGVNDCSFWFHSLLFMPAAAAAAGHYDPITQKRKKGN